MFNCGKRKQVISPKKEYRKVRHQLVTVSDFLFLHYSNWHVSQRWSVGPSERSNREVFWPAAEKNLMNFTIVCLACHERNHWVWVVIIYTSETISIWSGKTGTWCWRHLRSGTLNRLPTHNLNIWSRRRPLPRVAPSWNQSRFSHVFMGRHQSYFETFHSN